MQISLLVNRFNRKASVRLTHCDLRWTNQQHHAWAAEMASYVPGCEDQGKALQRQALQRTESVSDAFLAQ